MDEMISERIKQIRENLNYSQKKMSELINISQSNLAKIEKGNLNPSLEFMYVLRNKFGIDLNWLITGKGDMYISREDMNKEKAMQILLEGKSINEHVKMIMDSINDPILQNEMVNAIVLAMEEPLFQKHFLKTKREKEVKKVMVGGETG